jgi:hypothetical protein
MRKLFSIFLAWAIAAAGADIDVYQTTGAKQRVTMSSGASVSTAGAVTLNMAGTVTGSLPVANGGTGGTTILTGQTGLGIRTVYKPSDTIRTSTTTSAVDPHLVFTAAASTKYYFKIIAYVTVETATPDFKFGLNADQTATAVRWTGKVWSQSLVAATNGSGGYNPNVDGGALVNGITYEVAIEGTVTNGATPATIGLYWAQNTSSADDTIVEDGSFLYVQQL